MEAGYFLRATTGKGIGSADLGTNTGGERGLRGARQSRWP